MTFLASAPANSRVFNEKAKVMTLLALSVSVVVHLVVFLMIGSYVIIPSREVPPIFNPIAAGLQVEADEDHVMVPPQPDQPLEPDLKGDKVVDWDMGGATVMTPGDISSVTITDANVSRVLSSHSLHLNSGTNISSIHSKTLNPLHGGGGFGVPKEGFIGGERITARKLGAILDISYSTHGAIGNAVEEIKEGFPDAVLVLAPGCGMAVSQTGRVIEGRQFVKNIEDFHYEGGGHPKSYYSAAFLGKLLKVNKDFKKLWDRAAKTERGFVIHADLPNRVETDRNGKERVARTAATHHGFEFLIEQGCDAIYWMADFQDRVDPALSERILRKLKRNEVTVLMHDFDGGNQLKQGDQAKVLVSFSKQTGGAIVMGSEKSWNSR